MTLFRLASLATLEFAKRKKRRGIGKSPGIFYKKFKRVFHVSEMLKEIIFQMTEILNPDRGKS